jgi:tetratricopeptide (TPR) repeat protein
MCVLTEPRAFFFFAFFFFAFFFFAFAFFLFLLFSALLHHHHHLPFPSKLPPKPPSPCPAVLLRSLYIYSQSIYIYSIQSIYIYSLQSISIYSLQSIYIYSYPQGDLATAEKMYSMAIRLDPRNHVYLSNRSAARVKGGDWESGLEDAEEAIKYAPKWAKVRRKGGRLQACFRLKAGDRLSHHLSSSHSFSLLSLNSTPLSAHLAPR